MMMIERLEVLLLAKIITDIMTKFAGVEGTEFFRVTLVGCIFEWIQTLHMHWDTFETFWQLQPLA